MVRTLILVGISSIFALVSCSNGPTDSFNIEDLDSTVQKPRPDIPQITAFDMQRCVNMGNSFEAPKDTPWGEPINPADFTTIRAKGFDTVRIPVRWTDHTSKGPEYTIDPSFMDHVVTAVTAALDADLNVILNLHHYDDIFEYPEAAMPAYRAVWEQVAPRFKDAPDDLWFETLNEPHKALKGELMRQTQREGVEIIRKTNPDRVIILGGDDWSSIRALDSNIAPPDANIVYTFHYYDPFDFTHQKAFWLGDGMPSKDRGWGNKLDREQLSAAAQTAADYRTKIDRPIFVGEFGANSPIKNADRVKWAGAVRAEMEANSIPWCLWSYSNTFALYDNEKGSWDKDMLSALGVNAD
jgi:endoglucanase